MKVKLGLCLMSPQFSQEAHDNTERVKKSLFFFLFLLLL